MDTPIFYIDERVRYVINVRGLGDSLEGREGTIVGEAFERGGRMVYPVRSDIGEYRVRWSACNLERITPLPPATHAFWSQT